tara:strand:- start:1538 stop:1876 length:339 start_codon:yes stop_codon:yes gene_type:complete
MPLSLHYRVNEGMEITIGDEKYADIIVRRIYDDKRDVMVDFELAEGHISEIFRLYENRYSFEMFPMCTLHLPRNSLIRDYKSGEIAVLLRLIAPEAVEFCQIETYPPMQKLT